MQGVFYWLLEKKYNTDTLVMFFALNLDHKKHPVRSIWCSWARYSKKNLLWLTRMCGWRRQGAEKKGISINNFTQFQRKHIRTFEMNYWECKLPSFATLPKISEAVKWKRLQMTAIITLSNNTLSTNFYVYIHLILSAIAIIPTTI